MNSLWLKSSIVFPAGCLELLKREAPPTNPNTFSPRIALHLAPSIQPITPTSFHSPVGEINSHSIMLPVTEIVCSVYLCFSINNMSAASLYWLFTNFIWDLLLSSCYSFIKVRFCFGDFGSLQLLQSHHMPFGSSTN